MKKLIMVLFIVIAAIFILINSVYLIKIDPAKEEAESYLSDKYVAKMIYKRTERPPFSFESNPYLKVFFSPENNPDIEFYVHVNLFPVSIDEYTPTKLNLIRTSDNYLLKKFEYELSYILQNKLFEYGFSGLKVSPNNYFVHDVRISETMDTYETEKLTDYKIYVETETLLQSSDLWKLFRKIEELDLSPEMVVYFVDSKESVYFTKWKDIDEKQISEKLNELSISSGT